jgi:hypothetical protein
MAYPSFDKLEEVRKGYLDLYREYWLNEVLFSFDWWLLLAISIIPWIVWWKVVDIHKLTPILLYGFFVAMESVLLPVIYMLIYQKCTQWKVYILIAIFSKWIVDKIVVGAYEK